MSPNRPDSIAPASAAEKVELVLRLLRGETLDAVSADSGRGRKQLAAWRTRFLEGGAAALDGRAAGELETLRGEHRALEARASELEAENRLLARRVELLSREPRATRDRTAPHPNCSAAYARAFEETGVEPLHVPEWGTHVLVRQGAGGVRQATGVRPYASLDPDCDLEAGLDRLHRAGIATVSLITDPMWCPEVSVLQEAFSTCREFKMTYFVDRDAEKVQIRKRHRNMINRARRAGEIRDVELAEHLDRWQELYQRNVADRQIAQPFDPTYFDRLTEVPGVRTVAAIVEGEIVTMTIWLRHQDVLYYYDGASSATGFGIGASYAAFAHVVETATECRYVFFGGSSDFRDELTDGLAVFKRGFSNSSAPSYLCSASLVRRQPT